MRNVRFSALALLTLCAWPAHAMPAAPLGALQPALTIQVGGCGLGVLHGPFDNCAQFDIIYNGYGDNYHAYRQGYYRGYRRGYRRGYDDAYGRWPYVRYYDYRGVIAVDRGFCGFGSYVSCDHGLCWRYCY